MKIILIRQGNELGKDRVLSVYLNIVGILETVASVSSIVYILVTFTFDHITLLVTLVPFATMFIELNIGKKMYEKEKRQTKEYRILSYYNYLLSNDIAIKEIKSFSTFSYNNFYFSGKYHEFLRSLMVLRQDLVQVKMRKLSSF